MPGPSKKPENIKSLRGTSRNDRKTESVPLEAIDALPSPPDWLPNAFAVREWDRLGPILLNCGLLTEAGLTTFAHLCALHGRIVQLWTAGMAPTGYLYSQYLKLCDGFGMTPVAAQKVGGGGEKSKGNKFACNGRRI